MPREMTEAEASVLTVLLGAGEGSELSRVERSGAPRSTYVTARRRAYDQGWVVDRFLPSPELGFRWATFVLARPFLEHRQELEEKWTRTEGSVLLWRWPEHLFALFLRRADSGPSPSGSLVPESLGRSVMELRCDLYRPQVPVYFDYEGAWASLAGLARSRGYPRAFGRGEAPEGTPSEGLLRSVAELARRPLASPPAEGSASRRFMGAGGLPRSQRRLLQKGWAEWRVLPRFELLPPFEGKRVRRTVLLLGKLRRSADMEDLFHDLWESCGVAPFLLAGNEQTVLLGMVGTGEARPGGSSGQGRPQPPSSVGTTLQRHLSDIETVSASIDETKVLIDHRYDSLFP